MATVTTTSKQTVERSASGRVPTWPERAARWFADWWAPVGAIFLPCVIGVLALLVSGDGAGFLATPESRATLQRWAFWGTGVALLLMVPVAIQTVRQAKRTSALEDALVVALEEQGRLEWINEDLTEELYSVAELVLTALAKGPLQFGVNGDSCERISLYAHDGDGSFVLVGRWSLDPEFCTKRRVKYDASEGIIATAWRKGWHYDNSYPDPQLNLERYVQRCTKLGMRAEVVREIRMKSRLYAAARVSDTSGERQLAVVVVESTDRNRYPEDHLKRILQDKNAHLLSGVVERLAQRMPSLSAARSAGF